MKCTRFAVLILVAEARKITPQISKTTHCTPKEDILLSCMGTLGPFKILHRYGEGMPMFTIRLSGYSSGWEPSELPSKDGAETRLEEKTHVFQFSMHQECVP